MKYTKEKLEGLKMLLKFAGLYKSYEEHEKRYPEHKNDIPYMWGVAYTILTMEDWK
jgi:hypothetical protein